MSGSGWGKVSALLASVMDVHVRLALQELGREKRRLISGGLFLGLGLALLGLALLALHLVLLLGLRQRFGLDWGGGAAAVAALDLMLAGVSLRIGGQLLRGPYLPQTSAGLARTGRALTGRP